MSYKTFEFKDGKVIINEPHSEAQRKRTFMKQADRDAEAFIDSGADVDDFGWDGDEPTYGGDLLEIPEID